MLPVSFPPNKPVPAAFGGLGRERSHAGVTNVGVRGSALCLVWNTFAPYTFGMVLDACHANQIVENA